MSNQLTLDVDKFEHELKSQELSLSEDQWMSIIVSLRRAELPKNSVSHSEIHKKASDSVGLTLDEILDSYWIAAVDVATSPDFAGDGKHIFAKGTFTSQAKQQLSQLIGSIIGETYPNIVDADDFHIGQDALQAEQRQRAKEAGIDL